MSDLIDRQAAIDAVRSYMADNDIEDSDWHADGIVYEIKRLPTAEPKTGQWIKIHWKAYRCSECSRASEYSTDYCPNCGADMRGEQDDESRSNSNAQTDTRARGMGATDKSSGI